MIRQSVSLVYFKNVENTDGAVLLLEKLEACIEGINSIIETADGKNIRGNLMSIKLLTFSWASGFYLISKDNQLRTLSKDCPYSEFF